MKIHSSASHSWFTKSLIQIITLTAMIFSSAHAEVILHAFNWHYQDVADKAEDIAQLGYQKVLVAPPLKSDKQNCTWWARYQPQDLRVIDHCLGNKQDFESMIKALNKVGVETYADIVLNHMANERYGATDFPGENALKEYKENADYWKKQMLFGDLKEGLFSDWDFHHEFCIGNYGNAYEVEHGRICGGNGDRGLPDLDPNDWVRWQQRQYIAALKGMGVSGMRIDAAKHMSQWHINEVFTPELSENLHLFGEIITTGGAGTTDYEQFLMPYLKNTHHSAYDFPLHHSMLSAFSYNGSLKSLINPLAVGGAINGHRAITFVITHDIPTNEGFRHQIMEPTDERLAYAYILGRDGGVPLVFSDQTGVDNRRWIDAYKNPEMVTMIRFHNQMHGLQQDVLFADDCAMIFRRGKSGLVAINKCSDERKIEIETREKLLWFRDYRELFSGESFSIESSKLELTLPARDAQMWVVK